MNMLLCAAAVFVAMAIATEAYIGLTNKAAGEDMGALVLALTVGIVSVVAVVLIFGEWHA